MPDQLGREARLDAVELVVDGLVADRQVGGPPLVGGVDARLGLEGDREHQLGDLREEEVLLVLPLGRVAEELVEPGPAGTGAEDGVSHTHSGAWSRKGAKAAGIMTSISEGVVLTFIRDLA